ncbi:tRNA (guanine-N(7)-)-methyltransferase, partial [gut metagenome]
MRLRNIPGAKDAIASSKYVVQEPEKQRGVWSRIFKNNNPIHIEVGMGKGRFIMDLAEKNPSVNYIGIEMYDSVLLRALQKMEEREQAGTLPENLVFLRMDARELPLVFQEG